MLNLSNVLSLSRVGLAFAFLQQNPIVRIVAIALAMASDFLDGYIARKQKTVTQLGAILDPITDKFFVFFAAFVFIFEGILTPLQLVALISRDLALCLFGLYLLLIGKWKGYECKAIWWGKVTTVAQFFILVGLTLHVVIPWYVFFLFVLMGLFALIELFVTFHDIRPSASGK